MNKKVLLFVCLGFGASFLVLHFRPRNTHSSEPFKGAALPAVSNFSDTTTDIAMTATASIAPLAKPVSSEILQDSNTAIAGVSNAPETPTVPKSAEDKYAALRELTAWAAKDPEAALTAVMSFPEGVERDEALTAVCFGLAQKDPAEAVQLAQDLHLDDSSAAVMQDLVQQWAGSDLNGSLVWAADQPAGAPRDEFMTRIAFTMSQSAPSDAANLVMNQIPPGAAQDEAIMTVMHQWGIQNFAAAANWAKGVAAGPLQERVLSELKGILDYQRALAQN